MKNLDQTFIRAFNKQRPTRLRQSDAANRPGASPSSPEHLDESVARPVHSPGSASRIRIDPPAATPDAYVIGAMSVIPLAHITFPPVQHVETYDADQIADAVPDAVVLRDRMTPLPTTHEQTETVTASDPLSQDDQSESTACSDKLAADQSGVRAKERSSGADDDRELISSQVVSPYRPEYGLDGFGAQLGSRQFVSISASDLPETVVSAVGIGPAAELGYEETRVSSSLCMLQLQRIDTPTSGHVVDEQPDSTVDSSSLEAAKVSSNPEPGASTSDSSQVDKSTEDHSQLRILQASRLPHEEPESATNLDQAPATARELDEATHADRLVAAWEVDRFHWPEICDQLDASSGDIVRQSGEELCLAARDGLRVLAVTSAQRREGKTTLALALARTVANAGARVALVDADRENPELARRLGVEAQSSWCDSIEHGRPIAEAAIASVNDHITLFPLTSPVDAGVGFEDVRELAGMLQQLTSHFDLVIVDMQPVADPSLYATRHVEDCPFDMAVVVRHVRTTPKEMALAAAGCLRTIGLGAVGVVENFSSREAA